LQGISKASRVFSGLTSRQLNVGLQAAKTAAIAKTSAQIGNRINREHENSDEPVTLQAIASSHCSSPLNQGLQENPLRHIRAPFMRMICGCRL
jgi:hypothetical protein